MSVAEKKSIVCFGEILWDNLPEGKRPGGAPMNVAYHLHKLGLQSHLISSIGNDDYGRELLDFLDHIGVEKDWVQIDYDHNTSQVLATINEEHEVTYEIVAPVAWDYIKWGIEMEELVSQSDAFVFGSLASRNAVSSATLLKLVAKAPYRVFDINLRAPNYSPDFISDLLRQADLVKINAAELGLIANWNDIHTSNERNCIETIFRRFPIKEMLITKGRHGATYYNHDLSFDYPAYNIKVADTIGSGDSFLAAFLAMRLYGEPLEISLDYAVAMGAFITSQSGACPDYSKFDFDRLIWNRKWCTMENS